jgi:hypothetical protein
MTIKGGITKLRDKLRDDPQTQKLYSYYKSGGLQPGKAGRSVFCGSATTPQFESECNGKTYKKSLF